jgi:hypothetical protein
MYRGSDQRQQGNVLLVSAAAAALCHALWCTSTALADPLPGEVIKFQQKPLDGITPIAGAGTYWGHDELSTANGNFATGASFQGVFMADDFADKVSQPVVRVSWWGSYLDNQLFAGVNHFLISFESDVPASPAGGFSHPGTPLLSQVVSKGALASASGTFTEAPVSPGGAPLNETLFKYNAELKLPFPEKADTVYWLKIVALVNPSTDGAIRWGWHDRDYTSNDPYASTPPLVNPGEKNIGAGSAFNPLWHFQDDAVSGTVITQIDPNLNVGFVDQTNESPQNYIDLQDGPQGISQFSKDLAFELYYVPEPATTTTGMAALALTMIRRRQRRRRGPR